MARRKKNIRQATNWLNASVVGIQFPVAIGLGYLWGKWMDGFLGTEPWLTIIFSVFGIAAGFVNLFRITAAASAEEERLAKQNDDPDGDGDTA